jgi:outer membrane lipase/esterase
VLTPYKQRGLCLNIAFHKKERSFYLLMHSPKLGANTMVFWKHALSALGVALALVGCGGGSDAPVIPVSSAPPAATPTVAVTPVNTVKVVGDSLSDSGVFGFKWAMQSGTYDTMKVWTEIIADAYKAPALCAYYGAVSASVVVPNPANASCNSYAVGGGRINIGTTILTPFSIPKQLADLATNKPYTAGDLLLVDGGGNDAASLTGAFLTNDSGAAFSTLAVTLLPAASVTAILTANPNTTGSAIVGTLYMQTLADKMYDAVKVQALDKGAPRVIILNMPDITNTPRFQATLDLVAAAYGPIAGPTVRAQTKALIGSWVVAFNNQLASKFAGNSKVVLVDFYGKFNDQIANKANYGLTNVTTPACPPTLPLPTTAPPEYDTPNCTADSLSRQTPPSGAGTGLNWWKTFLFSDGFHPTIYGYQLLAQQVSTKLREAGWQ